jgi:hypothetical protein
MPMCLKSRDTYKNVEPWKLKTGPALRRHTRAKPAFESIVSFSVARLSIFFYGSGQRHLQKV